MHAFLTKVVLDNLKACPMFSRYSNKFINGIARYYVSGTKHPYTLTGLLADLGPSNTPQNTLLLTIESCRISQFTVSKRTNDPMYHKLSNMNMFLTEAFESRPPPPPPPHSILFRVRICLFPPLESTPLSPDWQHFWTPLSRAFRRLFLPWRPP